MPPIPGISCVILNHALNGLKSEKNFANKEIQSVPGLQFINPKVIQWLLAQSSIHP